MGEIRRRADEDKGLAPKVEDKRKIEAESQAKISEIKKRHETEKSELDRRQKDEKSTVQKGRIRKKDEN
jgi:hypothetical protein